MKLGGFGTALDLTDRYFTELWTSDETVWLLLNSSWFIWCVVDQIIHVDLFTPVLPRLCTNARVIKT